MALSIRCSDLFPPFAARLWGVVLTAALLTLAGCDSGGSLMPEKPADIEKGRPLPVNVRMQISYEQTETTFSNILPQDLASSSNAATQAQQATSGAGVMESYETIHETISYDEEGYLSRSYEYTEGYRGLNMPEDVFDNLKEEMPYDARSKDPIIRFELESGSMRFVRRSGEVAFEASPDPEAFRVDPEAIDSLEALSQDALTTQEREAKMRRRLRKRGLQLEELSGHHVAFETSSKEEGLSSVRRVIDLRLGQPVYVVYKKDDGHPELIETRAYQRISGVPVLRSSVSYGYGKKDGEWTVISRTEKNRKNISVQFN